MIKIDKTKYTATRQALKANIATLKGGMAAQLKALKKANANPSESGETRVFSGLSKVEAKGATH